MTQLNVVLCGLGIVLYGMLGGMALRVPGRGGRSGPLLGVATCGVLWHVTTLLLFDAPGRVPAALAAWVLAAGLVALGLLPALALEAAVSRDEPLSRGLRWAAYGASGSAGAAQLVAAATQAPVPQQWPLVALVVAHATIVTVLVVSRRGRDATRIARLAALAWFALSALHFAGHDATREAEASLGAVLAHHAAIPLAIALLLQDFPFAFADLFLKRAARLMVLTGVALGAVVLLLPGVDGSSAAIIVGVALVTALVAPPLGRRIDRLVDRVWLKRPALTASRADFLTAIALADDEPAVLDAACRWVARQSGSAEVRVVAVERGGGPTPAVVVPDAGRQGAQVLVPTLDAPTHRLVLSPALDGRRLLSDDAAWLEWIARETARRLDVVRREAERRAAAAREADVRRLATEAELRALRAQLNPHFLFNALTTLGWLMDAAPERAKTTLYRLTSLLRAVLGRTAADGDAGTLGEEIALLEDYLAIEQARFEERLGVEIDVPEALDTALLPPLLLQPLVENAIKHGISPRRQGGMLRLVARAHAGAAGDELHVHVIDTGVGFDADGSVPPPGSAGAGSVAGSVAGTGVGLANVRGRVVGHGGRLDVSSRPGRGTDVRVVLPLVRRRQPNPGPVSLS